MPKITVLHKYIVTDHSSRPQNRPLTWASVNIIPYSSQYHTYYVCSAITRLPRRPPTPLEEYAITDNLCFGLYFPTTFHRSTDCESTINYRKIQSTILKSIIRNEPFISNQTVGDLTKNTTQIKGTSKT